MGLAAIMKYLLALSLILLQLLPEGEGKGNSCLTCGPTTNSTCASGDANVEKPKCPSKQNYACAVAVQVINGTETWVRGCAVKDGCVINVKTKGITSYTATYCCDTDNCNTMDPRGVIPSTSSGHQAGLLVLILSMVVMAVLK